MEFPPQGHDSSWHTRVVRASSKTLVRASCMDLRPRVERSLRVDHHFLRLCLPPGVARQMAADRRVAIRRKPHCEPSLYADPIWPAQQCPRARRYPDRSLYNPVDDASDLAACPMGLLYSVPVSPLGDVCDSVADERHLDEQIAVYWL